MLAVQATAWAAAVPTVTQTLDLKPGWNAVYLEVQPASNSPAVVFRDLPPESSVWAWTGKNSPVQFIQDPSEAPVSKPPVAGDLHSSAESPLNNLYAITANSAYLIRLPAGAARTLSIEGRPTIRHKNWIPDSFNLTGFGFSGAPPTFAAFFAPSASHRNQAIYRLNNASGAWEIVNNPATTAMRSGEAFWIYCQSGSDYQGPLTVEANGADGLDFGVGITILTLDLRNASTVDKTVTASSVERCGTGRPGLPHLRRHQRQDPHETVVGNAAGRHQGRQCCDRHPRGPAGRFHRRRGLGAGIHRCPGDQGTGTRHGDLQPGQRLSRPLVRRRHPQQGQPTDRLCVDSPLCARRSQTHSGRTEPQPDTPPGQERPGAAPQTGHRHVPGRHPEPRRQHPYRRPARWC